MVRQRFHAESTRNRLHTCPICMPVLLQRIWMFDGKKRKRSVINEMTKDKRNTFFYKIHRIVSCIKWEINRKWMGSLRIFFHTWSISFINTSQNIFGAKSCEKLPIMMRVSRSFFFHFAVSVLQVPLRKMREKEKIILDFKSILFSFRRWRWLFFWRAHSHSRE